MEFFYVYDFLVYGRIVLHETSLWWKKKEKKNDLRLLDYGVISV